MRYCCSAIAKKITSGIILLVILLIFIPVFTEAQNCTCYLPTANLLTNSDFEDSATLLTPPNYVGFESDYDPTFPTGVYGIMKWLTSPANIGNQWCAIPGNNHIMFFDGSTGSGLPSDASVAPFDILRYPNLPVVVGQDYRIHFSCMESVTTGTTGLQIDVKLNGQIFASFPITTDCNQWKGYEACWTADTTSVKFALNAGLGSAGGRDFLIDSVYFGTCQPAIYNIDTTALDTIFCKRNYNHPILGLDAGGTFTGCGIVQQGNDWFFNPSLACIGVTTYPHQCDIHYTTLGGMVATRTMTVFDSVSVTAGPDQHICTDDFTLNATGNQAGLTYTWQPAQYLTNPTSATTTGSLQTQAWFEIVASNAVPGCIDSDTVTIYNNRLDAALASDKDTVCINDPIQFTSSVVPAAGVYNYAWIVDSATVATTDMVTKSFSQVGTHDVMLVVSNDYCSDTLTKQVEIKDFDISLSASSVEVKRLESITLTSGAEEPYTVLAWKPESYFSDQAALSQAAAIDTEITFIVVGASQYGCLDSADVRIGMVGNMYVPSAFSPNGDGLNDVFRPVLWGQKGRILHFMVFNRWGACLYHYQDNSEEFGWDGTYMGKKVDLGVYFYKIEAQLSNNKKFTQQGDVTVVR